MIRYMRPSNKICSKKNSISEKLKPSCIGSIGPRLDNKTPLDYALVVFTFYIFIGLNLFKI